MSSHPSCSRSCPPGSAASPDEWTGGDGGGLIPPSPPTGPSFDLCMLPHVTICPCGAFVGCPHRANVRTAVGLGSLSPKGSTRHSNVLSACACRSKAARHAARTAAADTPAFAQAKLSTIHPQALTRQNGSRAASCAQVVHTDSGRLWLVAARAAQAVPRLYTGPVALAFPGDLLSAHRLAACSPGTLSAGSSMFRSEHMFDRFDA